MKRRPRRPGPRLIRITLVPIRAGRDLIVQAEVRGGPPGEALIKFLPDLSALQKRHSRSSRHGLSKPLDSSAFVPDTALPPASMQAGLRRNDGKGRGQALARNGRRVIGIATGLFSRTSSFRRKPESTPTGMQVVKRRREQPPRRFQFPSSGGVPARGVVERHREQAAEESRKARTR